MLQADAARAALPPYAARAAHPPRPPPPRRRQRRCRTAPRYRRPTAHIAAAVLSRRRGSGWWRISSRSPAGAPQATARSSVRSAVTTAPWRLGALGRRSGASAVPVLRLTGCCGQKVTPVRLSSPAAMTGLSLAGPAAARQAGISEMADGSV